MNRLILTPDDFDSDGNVSLNDRRFGHLKSVIKAVPGKLCSAGMLNGPIGTAEVLTVGADRMTLHFTAQQEPPEKLPLTLVMALPRPQTLKKVLHSAVTFGVERLVFTGTFKVEKSYWSSPFLAQSFLDKEQLAALEQCGDTRMIGIEFYRHFKPFAEDVLPRLAAGKHFFAAHPDAATAAPRGVTGPAVLALGPEGGFTPYETELLTSAGAELVSLGRRILRTEVALDVLLGRLF